MKSLAVTSGILVGALALAGCVDSIPLAPPTGTSGTPSFAVNGSSKSGGGAGRHIVTFSGLPGSFAAQVEALGGKVLWASVGTGLAAVRGLSTSAAAALAGKPGVQSVNSDVLLALPMPKIGAPDAAEIGGVASNANPAAAVRFPLQWNMLAVQADAAWARGFLGASNVTVYMLDSGIDYLHADLVGRVDLARSADMLGSYYHPLDNGDSVLVTEADTVAKYFGAGQFAFSDLLFHGTHTAATVSSNAARAAGITSGTKLVALKVCSYFDECPFSSILGAVINGADNGADVMNLSLGGAFPKKGNKDAIKFINRVFEYATHRGVTIVVAAGNDSADLDHDPSNYHSFCDTPGVICVAATGPTAQESPFGPWTDVDAPAGYSNFGHKAIDVAAPGGNNDVTYVYAACSHTSLYLPQFGINCSTLSVIGAEGTSMSAPHVAGTAALLVSILGRHPEKIKARIEQTADRIGGGALRPFYGHGRLNVFRAVAAHEDVAEKGPHSH